MGEFLTELEEYRLTESTGDAVCDLAGEPSGDLGPFDLDRTEFGDPGVSDLERKEVAGDLGLSDLDLGGEPSGDFGPPEVE